MSQQPEAIRLAAVCDLGHPLEDDVVLIGPELLRLHAVELEAVELRAELSQEKEVVAALLAEQDRLQCALNKRHAQVERLQAAGQVLDASEIYKRGWVACAGWAKRPDLIADIDSPAYANERAARLATPQPIPAPVAAVPAMVLLTEEQMVSAVRPLCNTGQVAERLVAVSIDEYRAIEAAIAKINGLTVGDGAHSGALHCKKCHADRAKEGCRNQYRDCPFTGNAQPIKDAP